MRIAHINSTYPPYKGGMGNVTASFVEHLRGRGHDAFVLTPEYREVDNDPDYVIRLKPWLKYGNAAFIPQIYRYLDGVDIIHLHYPFFGGAEAVFLYKLLHPKKPLVITYHMNVVGTGIVKIISTVYRWFLQNFILTSANSVTCSSKDYADHSFMSSVMDKVDFREVPFGVSNAFKPLNTKNKAHTPSRLLFVGGLDKPHYFKGLSVLIESLSHLKNKVYLDVVGRGELQSHYKNIASKKGVLGMISFHDNVELENLISFYQNAFFTVLPSINMSEAFGLVLVESMACGTPVFASDLPGVRSVLSDGETGHIIPVGDAKALAAKIDAIIDDPDRYKEMRSASSARVEKLYRWPKIIDKLEQIYQDLYENRSNK